MKLKTRLIDVRTINALMTGAEAEAHRAGEEQPGAEHLLMAALDLADGSARRAFERIGAKPDEFRTSVAASHDDALRSVGVDPLPDDALDAGQALTPRGAFHMNASGRAAFQTAGRLARADSHSGLTGAHIVVAVAQMEHGTAARALRQMGVDPAALVEAANAEIAAPGSR
jgi:ATP-dependent Clp protease ATP-binding subunit ClpA